MLNALPAFDLVASSILLGFIFLYFFLGLTRAYGTACWLAALQALVVAACTWHIIVLYRFLLFVICFATT